MKNHLYTDIHTSRAYIPFCLSIVFFTIITFFFSEINTNFAMFSYSDISLVRMR